MIKVTRLSGPVGAPTMFLIPGGPGLSSMTLRSMDVLRRSFHLAYVDFQGANGSEYNPDLTLDEVMDAIVDVIQRTEGPVIVGGHSFGGIMAGAIALKTSVNGVVMLSSPLSPETFEAAKINYRASRVCGSREECGWVDAPTLETLKAWLASYGDLYFAPGNIARGETLLLDDPSSVEAFQRYGKESRVLGAQVLTELPAHRIPRLCITDELGVFPWKGIEKEAVQLGASFNLVKDASHFVMFDQPERVAQLIEAKFATQKTEGERA